MVSKKELLEKIKKYDTPSVTNVVATYHESQYCLGIYNPWTQNWYTDQSVKCVYPELGRTVGYAVTCVFGMKDPDYNRLTFMDVIDSLEKSQKPTVLIAKQIFPSDIASKSAVFGGNMTMALKSIGCVGVISDGPSRDIDEIREMKLQYMLTGFSAGHGDMAVHAINIPVSVAHMDVAPGEIIHMDENGACKFPADRLEDVVVNLEKLAKEEQKRISALSKAKTASDIRSVFLGHSYGEKK
jgi:regulator of RNase E activity RraA